ncbi:MAG: hypothetical protein SAJ37_08325 [Oscillatoria sp. PMC 1068.18]|nr:hypothetical protein [Oscillatoria sp. PMC 1076.18]MEC4988740.1 hypothetical protein [Oscillatoria sp. PMC 1068.18]
MAKEKNIPAMEANPQEAEHQAVQTAQTTAVNPPEEVIPSGTNPEENKQDLSAFKEQEEASKVKTTGGYGINKSGQMNNVAVEPEMYVEEDK